MKISLNILQKQISYFLSLLTVGVTVVVGSLFVATNWMISIVKIPQTTVQTRRGFSLVQININSWVSLFHRNRVAGDWVQTTVTLHSLGFNSNWWNCGNQIDRPVSVYHFSVISDVEPQVSPVSLVVVLAGVCDLVLLFGSVSWFCYELSFVGGKGSAVSIVLPRAGSGNRS